MSNKNLEGILAGQEATQHGALKKEVKACTSIIVESIHDSQLEYIKDKTLAGDTSDV